MALYLETIKEDGSVVFTPLENGQTSGHTSVNANPGEKFRVVDPNTGNSESVTSARVGDNLVVKGANNSVSVEICGFYTEDKDKNGCELVGPDGSIVAATAQPEVLLAANKTESVKSDDEAAAAVATTGNSGLSTGATVVGGVLLLGALVDLANDDGDAVGSDSTDGNGNAGDNNNGVIGDGDSANNGGGNDAAGGDNAGGGNDTAGGDNTGGGNDAAGGGNDAAGGDNAGGGDDAAGGDNTGGGNDAAGGDNAGGGNDSNNGNLVPDMPTANIEGGDSDIGNAEMADGSVTISGTAEPGSDITVSWFDSMYSIGVDDSGTYSIDIPVDGIIDGASQISIVASNANGTSDATTIDVTVSTDDVVPLPPVVPEDGSQNSGALTIEDLIAGDALILVADDDSISVTNESNESVQESVDMVETHTDNQVVDVDVTAPVNLTSILDDGNNVGMI